MNTNNKNLTTGGSLDSTGLGQTSFAPQVSGSTITPPLGSQQPTGVFTTSPTGTGLATGTYTGVNPTFGVPMMPTTNAGLLASKQPLSFTNPYNISLRQIPFAADCRKCHGTGTYARLGTAYPCTRCYRKAGYCKKCFGSGTEYTTGKLCTRCNGTGTKVSMTQKLKQAVGMAPKTEHYDTLHHETIKDTVHTHTGVLHQETLGVASIGTVVGQEVKHTTVPMTVEKKVPVTVEKIVPTTVHQKVTQTVPVVVPINVQKTVPVTVQQKVPVTVEKTMQERVDVPATLTTTMTVHPPVVHQHGLYRRGSSSSSSSSDREKI